MCAQPAGKQAVTVAHMHHVSGHGTRCADAAGDAVAPHVYIVLGVAHHCGFAGGAAGSVDAAACFALDGKHAKGVAVAQVFFLGEGELGQVGQRRAIVRVHASVVELGFVHRGVGVSVLQRGTQAFELQGAQFGNRSRFNAV